MCKDIMKSLILYFLKESDGCMLPQLGKSIPLRKWVKEYGSYLHDNKSEEFNET